MFHLHESNASALTLQPGPVEAALSDLVPPALALIGALPTAAFTPPLTLTLPVYRPEFTTAQNPVVPASAFPYALAPSRSRSRRWPAPIWLRLIVIALLAIFMVALFGLGLIESGSPWALRYEHAPISATAAASTPTPVAHASTMAAIASRPGTVRYDIPLASYQVALQITHPCWVIIDQIPSGKTLLASTLQPTSATQPLAVRGSVSIVVSAQTNAIVIRNGSTTIGTIPNPKLGVTYDLVAGSTSTISGARTG